MKDVGGAPRRADPAETDVRRELPASLDVTGSVGGPGLACLAGRTGSGELLDGLFLVSFGLTLLRGSAAYGELIVLETKRRSESFKQGMSREKMLDLSGEVR